jgi:hypothetical protein
MKIPAWAWTKVVTPVLIAALPLTVALAGTNSAKSKAEEKVTREELTQTIRQITTVIETNRAVSDKKLEAAQKLTAEQLKQIREEQQAQRKAFQQSQSQNLEIIKALLDKLNSAP